MISATPHKLSTNLIWLSPSGVKELYEFPHTYILKQLGYKKKHLAIFDEGKDIHRTIQQHVSGEVLNELLGDKIPTFPIVEKMDFDPQCHFEMALPQFPYGLHGYVDGWNKDNGRILEIKSSSTPWSLSKVNENMQWRCYGLMNPTLKEVVLVTCKRGEDYKTPDKWVPSLKVYRQPITQADRDKAFKWVMGAIDIIERADFKLEKNTGYNKCLYIDCPYCT